MPFRVIGIAHNQQEAGTVIFVPLTTARKLAGLRPDEADAYWIRTTSPDHGFIDRTATRLEDLLVSHGYGTGTEITYVAEREDVADYRSITTTITVLGFLIIAISMVGLVNALTSSVLERTREVGVLRSIGARARDVRRIFAFEGLALALAGWLAGVPIGYALDRALVWLIRDQLNAEVGFAFPVANLPIALVGAILLAVLVMLVPLRRAVRLRPGDAIRYT
jgi:putative ABC transport system permease protein